MPKKGTKKFHNCKRMALEAVETIDKTLEPLSGEIIKFSKRSKILRNRAVKGVVVGGCFNHRPSLKKDICAHAHSMTDEQNAIYGHLGVPPPKRAGWICFATKKDLNHIGTQLHELAHLLHKRSWNEGDHSKKWQEILLELGKKYNLEKVAAREIAYINEDE